ncbi:MAG: DegV family protein [Lachnospiraceae bacterium]|nr:DegV family protein [Lachnospiraceae bacterium]MBR3166614.1 DegV family protein [Lachnospiraceae bacterium]
MAVRIVTDSASDIPQTTAAEWNIKVLPLKIRFGEEEYLDGVTITPYEFYEKMEKADGLPKTSLIPPFEYEAVFEDAVNAGDEVVCLCISSGVSGAYQSACVAASDYQDHVHVIDTKQFCISEYIIVERAVQLRDEGLSAAEIAKILRKELKEAHVVAVFDTLEYLRKGGRISKTAAIAGTLLSIKPVLTITDGVVDVRAKVRGMGKGRILMAGEVEKLGGIDFERPVCFAYSGTSDAMMKRYIDETHEMYRGQEAKLKTVVAGAAIGTYAGPGAIAIAFFDRNGKS